MAPARPLSSSLTCASPSSLPRQIFRQSVEFCNDQDVWKLNVAHVLFMQDKYREAIGFYEPIVEKNMDYLLGISAVVLANLCVAYIMTSKNEEVRWTAVRHTALA